MPTDAAVYPDLERSEGEGSPELMNDASERCSADASLRSA
jgi:hypothetical protein